ncbi:MAG: L-threonylcarbamoyladenylate synthase [Candidatus Poseidoniaceae archaeon]|nr:L-threonylcarbamoyladenylate synthase [Candidatus Poseidoniaceae archaeon]|tara:strand:+ start:61 stop:669 length:609 start_codon:yes stop_codon:yes gene_type:complete
MSIITDELIDNLNSNGVVVYPTSTLPGLGCLPRKAALDNLYALKKRPASQPVSLGVADIEQANELVEVPIIAIDILQRFPQGSLTLILDAKGELDERLGGKRVAVRVLSDLRALELVNAVGPITATSANHSGVEPLYDTKLAGQELGLEDDCIVEGDCPGGAPSTILSIEKSDTDSLGFTVSIMREGVIPRIDVETWMRNYR